MGATANRVVKNTGYLYMKMCITMFISLLTTRLILNSLGASDFGIFNIVGGAIAMLGFLNAAMAGVTQRFLSYSEGEGDKEKQKTIFNISIVLHAAIAATAGIALIVMGYFFFRGILNIPPERMTAAKVVYGCLVASTLFTVMSVPYNALINAHENMRYWAMIGVFESLLKLSVAVAVVYSSADKLIVYGILMACIPFVVRIILRIYCHRHYEECVFAPFRYFNKSTAKEMTSFAGWNFIFSATSMISFYGNGVVLNHFFGTLLNAAQGIAGDVNGKLNVFASGMLTSINPVITKSEGAGNRERMIKTTLTGCKWSFLLFAIVAIPMLVETPYVLRIWLKNVPDWAVVFVRLQLVATMISSTTGLLGTSIFAVGKVKQYCKTMSLVNFLSIVLTYAAFAMGGSPVFMYVIFIAIQGIAQSVIRLYYAKKDCSLHITDHLRHVMVPCLTVSVVSIATGVSFHLYLSEGITRMLLALTAVVVSFVLTLWALGVSEKEREALRNVATKIIPDRIAGLRK